ncbi:hypothetical protein BDA99DRAFT_541597 [Phascolomyces articulosus]|uniref:Uncharacterized protein n=1 Tax=Phascolomyces articulosus TaxID=60185 RepID=A0AAD5K4U0_9FUNG|nr:hypothetical protein BDA99DRAFT_541597 [Phascolomyces articulosus]
METVEVINEGGFLLQSIKASLTPSNWFATNLCMICQTLPPNTLSQILINTPLLTYLYLASLRNFTESLNLIYNHAPQLQYLTLLVNDMAEYMSTTTYSRLQDERNDSAMGTGLKILSLQFSSEKQSGTHIDDVLELFVKRSHHSLLTLDIWYEDILTYPKTCSVLAEKGLPNLHVLRLVAGNKETTSNGRHRMISKFLSACPMLKHIQLEWHYLLDDYVYQVLGKLPHLTELHLFANEDDHDVNEKQRQPDLARDNQYHNETSAMTPMGASSTFFEKNQSLWSLHIESVYNLYYPDHILIDMMSNINKCQSLRKLDISRILFDNIPFVTFLESMKYSSIHTLKIQAPVKPIGKKELKALASIQHVEYLEIHDSKKARGEGFDKPRLFRLFQENQNNDHPFIVNLRSWVNINGWKRPSLPSTTPCNTECLTNVDIDKHQQKVKCLHKIYSIQELNDRSFYDKNDQTNYDVGNKILYKKVYCKECGCEHGQQTGYDVNGIYSDPQNDV